jgi:hypothetical protein
MIYDMRTYTLKINAVPQAEKLFESAMPERERYSRLGAFFHTEIGTMNQVVHFWLYDSLAHLETVRAQLAKEAQDVWPPRGLTDLIAKAESELLQPAPFMDPWTGPMQLGPYYELRTYTMLPGTRNKVLEGWAGRVAERQGISPLAGCWTSLGSGGSQNRLVHLWPYADLNERQERRREAAATGRWPAEVTQHYELMQTQILLPAAFSPLQ